VLKAVSAKHRSKCIGSLVTGDGETGQLNNMTSVMGNNSYPLFYLGIFSPTFSLVSILFMTLSFYGSWKKIPWGLFMLQDFHGTADSLKFQGIV
jgi:hypothetical protein